MAQGLNVFGDNGVKISDSVADFSINHNSVDSRFNREHYLYFRYTRNGDAHTSYVTFKGKDNKKAQEMGLSGDNAFFDIYDPNVASETINTGVVGNVLKKSVFGMPSGEAVSTGICIAPLPKNQTIDVLRITFYSPTNGVLDLSVE